jgi:hypothetical protein
MSGGETARERGHGNEEGRQEPPRVDAHVGTGPGTPAEFDLPADTSPLECEHCGRPVADEALLALHRGHAHPDRLTEAERAAFEEAYEAETAELRRFQLKAAGLVILLYFGLLMVYALV